jgi:hypothetical protein
MKNNNLKHNWSFFANDETVQEYIKANLALANLRNSGVEIEEEILEEIAFSATDTNAINYNTEYLQQKLGRFLTPTELEVVDTVMVKLLAYDNLQGTKLNDAGSYKRFENTRESHDSIIKFKENTLNVLLSLFEGASNIRFSK